MKNKKIIIAGLVIFCMIFGCAFSYAAFSESLTAKGTVSANSMFDVYFVKNANNDALDRGDVISSAADGFKVEIGDSVTAKPDEVTLNITVPYDFSSNDTKKFSLWVHNADVVEAIVSSSVSSAKDSKNVFTVSCTPKNVSAKGTEELEFTLTADDTNMETGTKYTGITLTLVYEQPDVEAAPAVTHNNH